MWNNFESKSEYIVQESSALSKSSLLQFFIRVLHKFFADVPSMSSLKNYSRVLCKRSLQEFFAGPFLMWNAMNIERSFQNRPATAEPLCKFFVQKCIGEHLTKRIAAPLFC